MSGVTERPPTEEELRSAVRKQMRFLVTSGNLVAQGDYDEAVRIAVSLRVLLHDSRHSRSVLGQLGWKDKLHYVNSLRPLEIAPGLVVALGTDEGETVGEAFGLVVLRTDQNGNLAYVAPLDEPAHPPVGRQTVAPTVPFAEWWKDKVLFSVGEATFSRWDLVDQMAHKDGGAHLDLEEMTSQFREYKLRGTGVVSIPLPPGQTELPATIDAEMWDQRTYPGDAASPTVLQIAWELLETLNRAGLPDGPAPE